jgi:hypothetical protein
VVARAPGEADAFLEHHRRAEGEQQAVQRVLAVGAPHADLDQDPDEPGEARRDDERQRVAPAHRQREPLRGELRRERRLGPEELQRDVGAEREERPVREVDLLHQPHDQHEAERDQREQQPERQPVDEMRE